jgi:hypothetical protein
MIESPAVHLLSLFRTAIIVTSQVQQAMNQIKGKLCAGIDTSSFSAVSRQRTVYYNFTDCFFVRRVGKFERQHIRTIPPTDIPFSQIRHAHIAHHNDTDLRGAARFILPDRLGNVSESPRTQRCGANELRDINRRSGFFSHDASFSWDGYFIRP